MKIGVINGNTNEDVSRHILESARKVCSPDSELNIITPKFGVPGVESFLDGAAASIGICDVIAEKKDDYDAFVIACFSDPGLYAARTICRVPVCGIAQASMLSALQLGSHFSLISPQPRITGVLEDLVNRYCLRQFYKGTVTIPLTVAQSVNNFDEKLKLLRGACKEALAQHKSDVLILAGAVLSGLDEILRDELGVPVLDPVKCAVTAAEACVRMRVTHNHDLFFSGGKKNFSPNLQHLGEAFF